MGEFHHVKGQFVRVVGDDGTTWTGTEAEFARDFGAAVPELPGDLTERLYMQGKRHALIRGGDVLDGGPLPWPQADPVIAALAVAIAAKEIRERSGAAPFDFGPTIANLILGS